MKYIYFLSVTLVIAIIINACLPEKNKSDLEKLAEIQNRASDNLSGEELSKLYCASCHAFPEPQLLSKNIWKESVLPQMGTRMGIRNEIKDPYKNMSPMDRIYVRKANIFPELPLLSNLQWNKIKIYYLSNSPENLPEIKRKESITQGHPLFDIRMISVGIPNGGLTTMIRHDTIENMIYMGDGRNLLIKLDTSFTIQEEYKMPSPPLDIEFMPDGEKYITCVGILHPNEQPLGKLIKMDAKGNSEVLIENLTRPVNTTMADLNNDGKDDFVFAEYGNNIGHLSWFENKEEDTFQERILELAPGSIQSFTYDFNEDGKLDIIALMAQGNEGIFIFTNKGNNKFSSKQVLQFPPVWGSSYFELADFNKDGHMDIVFIHGDNADYSMILKPYHGVRIFMNDGKNNFEESWFFPMNGASYGTVHDFDQDGDYDIGVIAFFPDFETQPPQNVIYLENISGNQLAFNAHSFEGTDKGRWIIMDKMDYDSDDDMDIVIGSFTFSPAPTPTSAKREWHKNEINIGLIENRLH